MRRFTAEPGHPSLAIVINMTEVTTQSASSWGTEVVGVRGGHCHPE